MRHRCTGFDCEVCERAAEDRAERQFSPGEQLAEDRRAEDRWERAYWGKS